LVEKNGTDFVSAAPQHTAVTMKTPMATTEPQRELVGHCFSRNHDDLRTAIREIGQSTGASHIAVAD
jgi:hypothetical protein